MTTKTPNITQARLFTSLVVVTLCLFVTAIILLRDINADNWQEELFTFYFPMLVLQATCIYLISLAIRVHRLEQQVAIANSYDPLTHTLKSSPLLDKAKKNLSENSAGKPTHKYFMHGS